MNSSLPWDVEDRPNIIKIKIIIIIRIVGFIQSSSL